MSLEPQTNEEIFRTENIIFPSQKKYILEASVQRIYFSSIIQFTEVKLK